MTSSNWNSVAYPNFNLLIEYPKGLDRDEVESAIEHGLSHGSIPEFEFKMRIAPYDMYTVQYGRGWVDWFCDDYDPPVGMLDRYDYMAGARGAHVRFETFISTNTPKG